MNKRRILFIINPVSGNGKALSLCERIYRKLDKTKFEITYAFTGAKGEGNKIAQKAIEERYDYVVAVGGDGTVNEIASAIVHTDIAMGIIPCGSGNGLARHMGILPELGNAIDVINKEKVTKIDYCMANDVKFFCTFGMGFDAAVSHKFAESSHRGFITYIEKTVKEYFNFKPEEYIIECNGEKMETTSFLITCANASQWGNNVYIAPQASVTDGLIDVITMEPFNLIQAGPIAFQLFTKLIDRSHSINMYRANQFVFHRKDGNTYHYDGEPILMEKTVIVRNIPEGLKVLIP